MKVTFWKGVFCAQHSCLEEAKLLKSRGFELHEPTMCDPSTGCRACRAGIGRRYWSPRVEDASRLRSYATPRGLSAMANHLRRLAQSRATDAVINTPAPAGLAYEGYQKAGIAFALQRKDTLFGDQMGVGKTIESLGFVNHAKPASVLVVCPATLVYNWRAEAQKWLVDPYRIIIPETKDELPDLDSLREPLLVITNYEKICGHSRRDKDGKQVVTPTPLSLSVQQKWNLIVIDEAHYLKNPDTLRSRTVLGDGGLYDNSRRSLFLTGTPMENRHREIWPLAARLCPRVFGDWWKFARRYCGLHAEQRGDRKVWVADGSTRPSELQQKLRSTFMIRRLRADVLKELPPKRRQLFVLDEQVDWSKYPELTKCLEIYEQRYDEALEELAAEACNSTAAYARAVRKLESIQVEFTRISDVRHKTGLLKLPACLRFTDTLLECGAECLSIFAHHRDIIEKIHQHYGDRSCVINGDTPKKKRFEIVKDFQEGRYQVFVGELRAAGTGITLTRAAISVFFETDWNPATVSQAEDRHCRYGQKKMVQIFHPVLDGSLDCNMVKKMLAKQTVLDKALDHLPESVRMQQVNLPLENP